MALPKQHRLGSNRDFNRVHRKGERASTPHLAIRALNASRCRKKLPPKIKSDRSAARDSAALSHVQQASASIRTSGGYAEASHRVAMPSKFGISISKKVSKRAVVRNRIKRQIRAVLHRHLAAVSPNWQVVIVVRPSAVECEFADFLRELEYLLRKLRITDPHP